MRDEECLGPHKLDDWMTAHDVSIGALAHALGFQSAAKVHYWLNGAQRPRAEMRLAVEKYTAGEVPCSAWLLPSEIRWLDALIPLPLAATKNRKTKKAA